jgi:hypothetical protein
MIERSSFGRTQSAPTDRLVGLWRSTSRHLEGVQHVGEDVEPDHDAGSAGVLVKSTGVVEQRRTRRPAARRLGGRWPAAPLSSGA